MPVKHAWSGSCAARAAFSVVAPPANVAPFVERRNKKAPTRERGIAWGACDKSCKLWYR